MIKSSSKDVSSSSNTQVGAAPSSFAKVKHLIGVDIKKVSCMQNVQDILLKYPTD
ncbi:unnamed protein product [Prunus armeniaca]